MIIKVPLVSGGQDINVRLWKIEGFFAIAKWAFGGEDLSWVIDKGKEKISICKKEMHVLYLSYENQRKFN